MKKIKMGIFYIDDMEENCKKIKLVAQQMKDLLQILENGNMFSARSMNTLYNNIVEVLLNWTGNTYVGCIKEDILKYAYQEFFETLYEFLINCRRLPEKELQNFANDVLYRGPLYRYLGHGNTENCDVQIEPEYNDIWVSWSKTDKNFYIESKLYGKYTKLSGHTGTIYGIDLTAFGVSKCEEKEVVYPTIKNCIDKIEYFEE